MLPELLGPPPILDVEGVNSPESFSVIFIVNPAAAPACSLSPPKCALGENESPGCTRKEGPLKLPELSVTAPAAIPGGKPLNDMVALACGVPVMVSTFHGNQVNPTKDDGYGGIGHTV